MSKRALRFIVGAAALAGMLHCSGGDREDGDGGGAGHDGGGGASNGTREGSCDCSSATCQAPTDGCGSECPGVCSEKEVGCLLDVHCGAGFACAGRPDGNVCLPAECLFRVLEPPLCGGPDALCGECLPCTPSCEDRECGPDPVCGQSCGDCADTHWCSAGGQCLPRGDFCEGELELLGTTIEPTSVAEEPPMAQGGDVADGVFDLVELRVYDASSGGPSPRREALRFFEGASKMEHLLETAEGEVRRLLDSSFSVDARLTALVRCPDNSPEIVFQRTFTAENEELWLLEPWGASVYQRRNP